MHITKSMVKNFSFTLLGNKIMFISIFLFCSCLAQKNIDIGDRFRTNSENQRILLMPPYGFQKQFSYSYKDVNFKGAVDANDVVIFISTSDPKFKINGVKYIGKSYESFHDKDRLIVQKGWGSYLPIAHNWYACFGPETLTAASKVSFVFKIK